MSDNKVLTSNFNNLYQPIYCNLFNTPNGFMQYQNSSFNSDIQTNPAVSFSQQNSEYNCLQKCKSDNWCTSYSYDTSNGKCTEYTTFPNKINSNENGKNIGYNLAFDYDFSNLSTEQKNNTIQKCVNQYINNTYTPKNLNIDLSSCGSSGGAGTDTYTVATNPQCLYNMYNNAGIPVKTIDNSIYNDNPSYTNSQTDSNIDDTITSFNKYNSDGQNISNINNILTTYDEEGSNTDQNNVFNKYINSINDEKNRMNDLSNTIQDRIGIERFENENNNNMYNNMSKFLILFIIIFLLWYVIIMVSK